jgi:hypothetical protein
MKMSERAYHCTHLPMMTKEECFTIGILIGIYMATESDLAQSALEHLEQYEASLVRKYETQTIH